MDNKTWFEELRKEQIKNSARNPGLAALMSFFVMGLGQIYAGQVDRGIFLLAIYAGAIFSAISIYLKGIVYQIIAPIIGIKMMLGFIYISSVFVILLWIYNIKDAYHLSLFSSYRDWFEVERVLLPVFENNSSNLLLDNKSVNSNITPGLSNANESVKPVLSREQIPDIEETEVISNEEPVVKSEKKPPDNKESEQNNVIYSSDIDYAMSTSRQSWKVYAGIVLVFLLLGSWINKTRTEKEPRKELFSLSANLNTNHNNLTKVEITDTTKRPPEEIPELQAQPKPQSKLKPDLLRIGFSQLSNGNTKDAVESFKKYLKNNSPSQNRWKLMLQAFYRAESSSDYENQLRNYLEKYPKDYEEWNNLGKVLYDRKDYTNSARAFTTSLKINPDSIRANFLLGSIYQELKLFTDAKKYLSLALVSDPLNIEINKEYAAVLVNLGDNKKATKILNTILKLEPDDETSAQLLEKIKDESPKKHSFVTKLGNKQGVIFVQGKKTPVLIENDKKTNSHKIQSKNNANFENNNIEIVNANKSKSSIIKESVSALLYEAPTSKKTQTSKQKKSDSPKTTKVEVKHDIKKVDKKNTPPKSTEKKLKIDKNSGISQLELASALKKTSDKQNLRDAVAVETDGDKALNSAKLLRAGFQNYAKGHLDVALTYYLKYLKDNKDPKIYNMVGLIFEKLGMEKDSYEASEQAYKLGNRSFSNFLRLGKLAIKNRDYSKSEIYLHKAIQSKPNRVDVRLLFAECLATNGKKNQAISELQSILNSKHYSYAIKQKVISEIKKIRTTN